MKLRILEALSLSRRQLAFHSLAALLAAAMLCGCGGEGCDPTTQTPETLAAVTEPSGCYTPGSDVEQQTGGAVRAYSLQAADCYAIAMDGEDVLLLSGTEVTSLTRLAGENLYVTAQASLDLSLPAENLQITGNGITYYDDAACQVVYLDADFKEVKRIQTPAEMTGYPILSANRMKLYYCTADALRVLDLETGLDRLLKEMTYENQSLQGILLDDTVLYCTIRDGGTETALFLSAENGAKLGQTQGDLTITSYGSSYYASRPEGIMVEKIFGQAEGEAQTLNILDETMYLEEIGCALGIAPSEDGLTLRCYDLTSGLCAAELCLDDQTLLGAETDGTFVYLLAEDGQGGQTLYRWDIAQTPSGDETLYTSPRYTLENPDTEALAACAQEAQRIGEVYGLEILVGLEAAEVQPWDYEFSPEYQPLIIRQELAKLEALLENFPAGFFEALAETASGQPVKLCLVRGITGSPESGSLEAANGIQFWQDEAAYTVIAAGDTLERTFYHELFHVIETRVFSECTAYYDWDSLNPKDFSYDYSYTSAADREGSKYLEDETRAFIDAYAMTYPKEDRARIMEYAATAGNENYFISDTMQAKLKTLCQGIREAFDLREYPNVLIWEQYLRTSLTP